MQSRSHDYIYPLKLHRSESILAKDDVSRVNTRMMFPVVFPNAFGPAQCDEICRLGEALGSQTAIAMGDSERSKAARLGRLAWLGVDRETDWIYEKVVHLFGQANSDFDFTLGGLAEPLQYTLYDVKSYFDWHHDIGFDESCGRKLSMTIQLSDPEAYIGGDLEFHNGGSMPIARRRGAATVFPAFLAHRVSPIVSGHRKSLVSWAYGPAFT